MSRANWWLEREPREQRTLLIGGAILALALFYIGIHEPLHERHLRARATLKAEQITLDDVRNYAATAANAQPAEARFSLPEGQSIVAFINDSTERAGLDTYVRRIQPRTSTVTIILDKAPFAEVAEWLTSLAREFGLHVAQINIDQVNRLPGVVNVNATFTFR